MVEQLNILSDAQWDEVKYFFDTGRKRKHDLRRILDSIMWILRTGAPWRLLDSGYPKWSSVYYYFNKWTAEGTLEAVNEWLNRCEREACGKEETPSLMAADSQSVKLAPFLELDRGLDGNKKINGRKRQILVDTLGNIWASSVHAANISDTIGGVELIEKVLGTVPRLEKILIDSGYKGTFTVLAKEVLGVEVEMAVKAESTKGFVPIAKRWVVEGTFAWFNFYRRLSKDYEQKVENSASWIICANISINLKRLQARCQT